MRAATFADCGEPLDVREIDDPAAVVLGTIRLGDVSDTLDAMSDYGTSGMPVVDGF